MREWENNLRLIFLIFTYIYDLLSFKIQMGYGEFLKSILEIFVQGIVV